MNKKGQYVFDVIIYTVVIFAIILFFGLMYYGFNFLNIQVHNLNIPNNSLVDVQPILNEYFDYLTGYVSNLKIFGICLIIGMFITIIISGFFLPSDPPYFVGYVLASILAVVLAIVLSSAYTHIPRDQVFNTVISHDPAGNFILTNLPLIIFVIACVGAIILFSRPRKDEYAGGYSGGFV